MSLETNRKKPGKQPITFVELQMDTCLEEYNVAPCQPSPVQPAALRCFKTFATCQDKTNYRKGCKPYFFCSPTAKLPAIAGCNVFYPCMVGSPTFKATAIEPGKGIGSLGSVTLTFQDFRHHDRGVDPYVSGRSYTPETQGTFWTKFLARNKYYKDRILIVYTGYYSEPFDCEAFEKRTFVITDIQGPNSKGLVTITGKDILAQTNFDKVQVPAASSGKLAADMDTSTTTLTLQTGQGSEYVGGSRVRIGKELIDYTGVSGDTLTGVTRATVNTTAESHSAGDTVQLCKVYNNVNIVDIIYDLLKNEAGLDDAYLPYNNSTTSPDLWDTEKQLWLQTHNFTRTIHQPTSVRKLLDQLVEVGYVNLFWHQVDAQVKLISISPPVANLPLKVLDDTNHFVRDSIKIKRDDARRVSEVWVNFAKRNPLDNDEFKNYHITQISVDSASASDNANGRAVKRINTDWLDANNTALAGALAGRTLNRFSEPPRLITFRLSAKDDYDVGDLIDVKTAQLTDEYGQPATVRFEITQRKEVRQGAEYEYTALESNYTGRYCFIAPNSIGDYSSETAANRARYGFIAPNSNVFSDGEPAYKII